MLEVLCWARALFFVTQIGIKKHILIWKQLLHRSDIWGWCAVAFLAPMTRALPFPLTDALPGDWRHHSWELLFSNGAWAPTRRTRILVEQIRHVHTSHMVGNNKAVIKLYNIHTGNKNNIHKGDLPSALTCKMTNEMKDMTGHVFILVIH